MKRNILISIAIISSFLLISSYCPTIYAESIISKEKKDNADDKKLDFRNECLNSDLQYGYLVKRLTWGLYFKPIFIIRYLIFKNRLDSKLSELPEDERTSAKDFFDIDSTFSRALMKKDIKSVHMLSIDKDVELLLKQPDNYEDFLTEHAENALNYLNWKEAEYSEDYPAIDWICKSIEEIFWFWGINLKFGLGSFGVEIANAILITLFAPIIVKSWMYVACNEAVAQNTTLRYELENMSAEELAEEGVLLLLKNVYDEEYLEQGSNYILSKILLTDSWT